MTYSELEIDASIMRDSSAGFFDSNNDDYELENLFKVPAKNQLKIDICGVLNYRPESTSDMSSLDTLVNENQTYFKQALMYLQFVYYFKSIYSIGSKTEVLLKDFMRLYSDKIKEGQNLKINSYNQAVAKRLLRG